MMYPSFPNLGPSWPEVRYARFISCFLSSGRVVIMAYSSVFCGKRSTNGMVVFPKNIFENSDFLVLLSQAQGDRQILAKQLGISPHQLSYVTHTNSGEGLLFFGNTTIPFVDRFPQNTELYAIMTTRPEDKKQEIHGHLRVYQVLHNEHGNRPKPGDREHL